MANYGQTTLINELTRFNYILLIEKVKKNSNCCPIHLAETLCLTFEEFIDFANGCLKKYGQVGFDKM